MSDIHPRNNAETPRKKGLTRAVEAGLQGEQVTPSGVLYAVGGVRGLIESLLPPTLYVLVYMITADARLSAIPPLALSVIALLARLLRKEPLAGALAGLLGVGLSVAAVTLTGEGSSYFIPGFFVNAGYLILHLVPFVAGWPLMGFVLGFFRGSYTAWRKERQLFRAAQITSLVWIAIFASRLAVQLPLYFANEVELLGVARLAMGIPLFVIGVVFTWLVLSRVSSQVDDQQLLDQGSTLH